MNIQNYISPRTALLTDLLSVGEQFLPDIYWQHHVPFRHWLRWWDKTQKMRLIPQNIIPHRPKEAVLAYTTQSFNKNAILCIHILNYSWIYLPVIFHSTPTTFQLISVTLEKPACASIRGTSMFEAPLAVVGPLHIVTDCGP